MILANFECMERVLMDIHSFSSQSSYGADSSYVVKQLHNFGGHHPTDCSRPKARVTPTAHPRSYPVTRRPIPEEVITHCGRIRS